MNSSKTFGSIRGSISAKGSLQGTLTIPCGRAENYEFYEGEYKVTPTDEVQVLPTAKKVLKEDIIVESSLYNLPEDSEIADNEDVDDVIEDVFGDDYDGPTYSYDDIATEEDLNSVLADVFG